MKIPLYLDGFVIDSKERLPFYLDKLYRFKWMSITMNDLSCLFMFDDFDKIMSNISKSLMVFSIWANIKVKTEFTIRTHNKTLHGIIDDLQITINNEHICESWCDKKIHLELNKKHKTDCCKEIEQSLHNKIIFEQYRQLNTNDLYKNLVFSNFLKQIEFYDSNRNPLLIFFGLAVGIKRIPGLLAKSDQILENIPEINGINLPIIKDPEHYRSLSTDTKHCISQQLHAWGVLRHNWGLLPIITGKNTMNLLDIAIHNSNKRLYTTLYENDLADLFKLYYRKIDKETCPQFIDVRGGGSINRDAIFIRRLEIKTDLTNKEVSHYNYILKLIKGILNKKYY